MTPATPADWPTVTPYTVVTLSPREASWVAPGRLVAVRLGRHEYRATVLEQVEPGVWKVHVVAGGTTGGIYEVGLDGPDAIERLIG